MGFSSISRVEICSTSMFLVDLCFILSSILFCIFMLRKILHGHVEEDPLSATDTIDSPLDEADKMVEEMPSEKRDTAPGASTIGKRATISGVHYNRPSELQSQSHTDWLPCILPLLPARFTHVKCTFLSTPTPYPCEHDRTTG